MSEKKTPAPTGQYVANDSPKTWSVRLRGIDGEILVNAKNVEMGDTWLSFRNDGALVARYQLADVVGYRVDE